MAAGDPRNSTGRWRGFVAAGVVASIGATAAWLALTADGEPDDAGAKADGPPMHAQTPLQTEPHDPAASSAAAAVPLAAQPAQGAQPRSLVDQVLFNPRREPLYDWDAAALGAENCWFETEDGLRLNAWYFRARRPRAVVLFAHGNAGNVTYWAGWCGQMRDRWRISVLLFDYRGFGRSEGRPTIDGVLADGRAARDYLAQREGIEPHEVVLLGHSLGGAVVADMAARDGARGLILERTFSSLRDVAAAHAPPALVRVLVPDKLNSIRAIAEYHGPVLISHGEWDDVVPF